MTLCAIVPVRPFEDGKTRLAPFMTSSARIQFNRALFRRTLAVLGEALAPDACIVVSSAAEVLDHARCHGFRTLDEGRSIGLNSALALGAAALAATRPSMLLTLSVDLPFLEPVDILSLMQAAAAIAIGRDLKGSGTNALLMRPPQAIPFCFGPDSFTRHLAAAQCRGLTVEVVERFGLAADIDTPEDIKRFGGRVEDVLRPFC